MTVEELVATLGLEIDGAAFKAGEQVLESLHHGLLGIAAAAVAAAGAIGFTVKKTAEYADEVDKAAQRTGLTTDALQELNYAATLAGLSAGELEMGLKFIQKNAYNAAHGSTELAEKFAALGINLGEFNQLKPDEQLAAMAEALSHVTDQSKRAALSTELMGRAGSRLIPLLGEGAEGLDKLREEARALGGVLDPLTIKMGKDLKEANESVEFGLASIAREIGAAFMPAVLETTLAIKGWLIANRGIISQKIHMVIDGIQAALKRTLLILEPFLDAFKAIVTNGVVVKTVLGAIAFLMLGALGSAIGSAVAAVWTMVTAFTALGAAEMWAAIVPVLIGVAIALLVAAVVLLVDEFETFNRGGKTFLGDYLQAFTKFEQRIRDFIASEPVQTFLNIFRAMGDVVGSLGAGAGAVAGGGNFIEGFSSRYNSPFNGGASSPSASVANSPIYGPPTNGGAANSVANITINAQTGASAQEIGLAARQAFDDHKLTEYRETHGVLRGVP